MCRSGWGGLCRICSRYCQVGGTDYMSGALAHIVLVNVAMALILTPKKRSLMSEERRWLTAIALVTACTTIFRSELAVLVGPLALQSLLSRKVSFWNLVTVGLGTAAASIGASPGWHLSILCWLNKATHSTYHHRGLLLL